MRIVHIEAGRHLYGGAAQVRQLVSALAAARIDNVLVCAQGGELAADPPAGARVAAVPLGGDLDVGAVRRIRRVLAAVKPDLVHVHSRRGAELFGAAAAALARVPAVLTRRVDAPEPRLVARLKYRPYRAVVAISRAVEAQLARAVEPARLVRIASAVDTERHRPDPHARARVLDAFGLPPDARVVGVAAQLIARKRHAWLFGELPALVARLPSLRVLCFGRGPLERVLRAELAARGLEAHVRLVGFRSDWPQLLPGLDVLAHPAAREGLGVVLLEAASAGVPVVACSVGGVPDAVIDGVTGRLAAVDDPAGFARALGGLLEAPDERARLGSAARAHVARHFSIDAMAQAHVSLYRQLAGAQAAASVAPAAGARSVR